MNRFELSDALDRLEAGAHSLRIVVLFFVLFGCCARNLIAQIPDEKDALHQRIEQLEDEIRRINVKLNDGSDHTNEAADGVERVNHAQFATSIDNFDPYCPDCESVYIPRLPELQFKNNPYPTVNWSGFVQLDSGWVYQDENSKIAIGCVESKAGLRRVRLRMDGRVRDNTTYLVDLDFAASGHPSFRDIVLEFEDVPYLQNVYLGYFQQPFGLDAMTSGRELVVLERPLSFAFAPFRQTGIGTRGNWADERISFAMTAYRFPTDAFGISIGDSGGYATALRLTGLPVYKSDEHLIHVGFGFTHQDPGNNIIRYAIEPGFFVTDPANPDDGTSIPVVVDTGEIPANSANLFNFELAAHNGPVLMTSEARFAVVDQVFGPTLGFSGFSAMLACVLTGESRPYDKQRGTFRRVIPDRDWDVRRGGGAWEVAVEWSFIDLNDANIKGGRSNNIIYGLNWHLHRHAKLSLNLIQGILDDPVVGNSRAWIVATRAQVEF